MYFVWISSWLVVWNMFFPFSWEFHNPNWRSPSFFRGVGLNHQPASLCQMDEWILRGIFFGMVNVNPGWTNSPSLSIGIRLVDWCLTFFQIGQVGDIRWPSLKTDLLSLGEWLDMILQYHILPLLYNIIYVYIYIISLYIYIYSSFTHLWYYSTIIYNCPSMVEIALNFYFHWCFTGSISMMGASLTLGRTVFFDPIEASEVSRLNLRSLRAICPNQAFTKKKLMPLQKHLPRGSMYGNIYLHWDYFKLL